jgi:hypothetical protein
MYEELKDRIIAIAAKHHGGFTRHIDFHSFQITNPQQPDNLVTKDLQHRYCVAYPETQGCHDRKDLDKVLLHAK